MPLNTRLTTVIDTILWMIWNYCEPDVKEDERIWDERAKAQETISINGLLSLIQPKNKRSDVPHLLLNRPLNIYDVIQYRSKINRSERVSRCLWWIQRLLYCLPSELTAYEIELVNKYRADRYSNPMQLINTLLQILSRSDVKFSPDEDLEFERTYAISTILLAGNLHVFDLTLDEKKIMNHYIDH
jgi:hypothetical protein